MNRDDQEPIIEAENLTKHYRATEGFVENFVGETLWVKALDGVNFELYEGETLGVVGESGCGKTTLGRSLIQLVEPTDGSVHYDGYDLTEVSSGVMRDLRKQIQYIFQNPFASLNPKMTVGDIIGEPLDIHNIASGQERQDQIYELLEIVGLNPSHAHRYPHEFSGGQRQRIGIARALAVDPEIIVCDEPVSALDVSVQAQILNLLEDLQEEFDLSYIFIAHDLSVVEHISDRIAVMYLGEIVEMGETEDLFAPPYHPYTEALLSAIPEPDPLWEGDRILLPGVVPSPISPPSGCKFHTRCHEVIPPESLNLAQEEFRGVMTFRQRLGKADELEGIAPTYPEDEPDLGRAIRDEFDLPDRLSDVTADEAFLEAVRDVESGDFQAALSVLEETFRTPCEVVEPAFPVEEDHRIACHLYDERYRDGALPDADEAPDAAPADD